MPTAAARTVPDLILTDPDGDHMEVHATDAGIYVTVDQSGVIATAGPFPALPKGTR